MLEGEEEEHLVSPSEYGVQSATASGFDDTPVKSANQQLSFEELIEQQLRLEQEEGSSSAPSQKNDKVTPKTKFKFLRKGEGESLSKERKKNAKKKVVSKRPFSAAPAYKSKPKPKPKEDTVADDEEVLQATPSATRTTQREQERLRSSGISEANRFMKHFYDDESDEDDPERDRYEKEEEEEEAQLVRTFERVLGGRLGKDQDRDRDQDRESSSSEEYEYEDSLDDESGFVTPSLVEDNRFSNRWREREEEDDEEDEGHGGERVAGQMVGPLSAERRAKWEEAKAREEMELREFQELELQIQKEENSLTLVPNLGGGSGGGGGGGADWMETPNTPRLVSESHLEVDKRIHNDDRRERERILRRSQSSNNKEEQEEQEEQEEGEVEMPSMLQQASFSGKSFSETMKGIGLGSRDLDHFDDQTQWDDDFEGSEEEEGEEGERGEKAARNALFKGNKTTTLVDSTDHNAAGTVAGGSGSGSYAQQHARSVGAMVQDFLYDTVKEKKKKKKKEMEERVTVVSKRKKAVGGKTGARRQEREAPASADHESERPMSALEEKHVKLLDQEIKKVMEEKKKYKKMQAEYKKRMANLEQAEQEFDRRRDAEIENIQVMKEKAEKRLKRDRRVLDQQSRTLLSKIPSKKDREEIQQLEALIEKERTNHKRKERTHKMNEDRLRRQLAESARKNEELKDEIRRLEKRHLDAWAAKDREGAALANTNTSHRSKLTADASAAGRNGSEGLHGSTNERVALASVPSAAPTKVGKVLENVGNIHKEGKSDMVASSKGGTGGHTLHKKKAGKMGSNNLVDEKHHNDGRVEKFFSDGRRKILYLNGTTKDVYSNSDTVIHFTNGDTKKAYGNGSVEYYYAEVDTWHTTHSNGIEVFHFPSGQIEAHFPNGTKEVLFPDGIAHRLTDPEGDEHQTIDPSDLCYVFSKPKPQISLIKT